jgi:tetratricopeptide (TPR) repeat protein
VRRWELTKLVRRMRSPSLAARLKAVEMLRRVDDGSAHSPEQFDQLSGLSAYGLFLRDFLYDLELDLSNAGLEDLRLSAARAQMAHWVWTRFGPKAPDLDAHFRGIEAEALWETGQTERAEALFEELTGRYPDLPWGYILWAGCYWEADSSYAVGPDYSRAEALYRRALANPRLGEPSAIRERLEDLVAQRLDPSRRDRIRPLREARLARRHGL